MSILRLRQMVALATAAATASSALSYLLPTPTSCRIGKSYPRSSEGERLRRARQIAKGQLTRANGLAWPGQVISRPDGKLYLQRPFYG